MGACRKIAGEQRVVVARAARKRSKYDGHKRPPDRRVAQGAPQRKAPLVGLAAAGVRDSKKDVVEGCLSGRPDCGLFRHRRSEIKFGSKPTSTRRDLAHVGSGNPPQGPRFGRYCQALATDAKDLVRDRIIEMGARRGAFDLRLANRKSSRLTGMYAEPSSLPRHGRRAWQVPCVGTSSKRTEATRLGISSARGDSVRKEVRVGTEATACTGARRV